MTQPNNPIPAANPGGYGKPPKKHQFKKGQSGNPKGRPKKPKEPQNYAQLTSMVLGEEIVVQMTGKAVKMTQFEALIRTMVTVALKSKRPGDALALLEYLRKLGIIRWHQEYQEAITIDRDRLEAQIRDEMFWAAIDKIPAKYKPDIQTPSNAMPFLDPDPDDEFYNGMIGFGEDETGEDETGED